MRLAICILVVLSCFVVVPPADAGRCFGHGRLRAAVRRVVSAPVRVVRRVRENQPVRSLRLGCCDG